MPAPKLLWLLGAAGGASSGSGTPLFRDSFTRADNTTIGFSWTDSGNLSIVSNKLADISGASTGFVIPSMGSDDNWCQWRGQRGGNSSNDTEGIVRWNASGTATYYMGRWRQAATAWEIYKAVAGVFTQLATTGSNAPVDETDFIARLEVSGTTLTLYEVIAGVKTLRLSVTDSAISTGAHTGIRINRAGAADPTIDDYACGPMVFNGVSVSDNMTGGISTTWNALGSWTAAGNNVSTANNDAQLFWEEPLTNDHYAEFDLVTAEYSTAPSYAHIGVCVRIENLDTQTYYMGRYYGGTGNWEIYKRVAGTFTLLASAAGSAPTTPHRVRLEAVGSTISLYEYSGSTLVLKVSVSDTAIPVGCHVGMRAGTGGAGVNADTFLAGSIP